LSYLTGRRSRLAPLAPRAAPARIGSPRAPVPQRPPEWWIPRAARTVPSGAPIGTPPRRSRSAGPWRGSWVGSVK